MTQDHITGLEVTASENNTVYSLELIRKVTARYHRSIKSLTINLKIIRDQPF